MSEEYDVKRILKAVFFHRRCHSTGICLASYLRARKVRELTTRQQKRWKTPLWFKMALGMFGTICILIAIVGSLVH